MFGIDSLWESDEVLSLEIGRERNAVRYIDDEVYQHDLRNEVVDNELADVDSDERGGLQAVGENREGGARVSFGEDEENDAIALDAGSGDMFPRDIDLGLVEALELDRIQVGLAVNDWDEPEANDLSQK